MNWSRWVEASPSRLASYRDDDIEFIIMIWFLNPNTADVNSFHMHVMLLLFRVLQKHSATWRCRNVIRTTLIDVAQSKSVQSSWHHFIAC